MDFSKKKKKVKKKKKAPDAGPAQQEESKGFNWNEGHTEYEYSFMLDRIERIMNEKTNQSEDIGNDKRLEMPQAVMVSTKTSIMNFDSICQQIERDPTHVMDFMKAEMDVEGNFGNEGNVLLKGRHKGNMINGLYKKYIEAYVLCLACKGI